MKDSNSKILNRCELSQFNKYKRILVIFQDIESIFLTGAKKNTDLTQLINEQCVINYLIVTKGGLLWLNVFFEQREMDGSRAAEEMKWMNHFSLGLLRLTALIFYYKLYYKL